MPAPLVHVVTQLLLLWVPVNHLLVEFGLG